jgi:DNA-binding MarR family transcriptional regulator
MMSNVPIPLTGVRAVFVGLIILILGLVSLYNGYKLPLPEAINLVHGRGRGITASELVHLMRVDRVTANRIIQRLIEKGFLRTSADRTQAEEVFDPVQ